MNDFSAFCGRAVLKNGYRGGIHAHRVSTEIEQKTPFNVRAFADESTCADVPRARAAQAALSNFVANQFAGGHRVNLVWLSSGPQSKLHSAHPQAHTRPTNRRALSTMADTFAIEVDGVPLVTALEDPYHEGEGARRTVLNRVRESWERREASKAIKDDKACLYAVYGDHTTVNPLWQSRLTMRPQTWGFTPQMFSNAPQSRTISHNNQVDHHARLPWLPDHFYRPGLVTNPLAAVSNRTMHPL